MFEIGIFCIILFAIGYWTTLFIMGRRDDVLLGEFVEAEPELISAPTGPQMPFPGVEPAPPRSAQVAAVETAPSPVVIDEPAPKPEPISARAAAVPPAIAATPVNTERLQSLLVSIKQELKNAAKI